MKQTVKQNTWREICKHKYIYLILSFGIIYLLIFAYIPMGGLMLAFKTYKAKMGILGSPFVGLKHFQRLVEEADFWRAVANTLQISFGRILFEFPMPVILAILVSELRAGRFKKTIQTILTFPHFLSWVVVAAIVTNIFEYSGIINQVLGLFGCQPITFLAEKTLFRPLLYFTSVWKESGWTSIIYLSAIAAIDGSLYEAASIDGAGRLQRIWHITLPGIKSTIFESEKNKLVYDMEIEPIYLLGNFSVKTDGIWEELERNAVRYHGDFIIDAPKKEVSLIHLEQQGYPFFSGKLVLDGEIEIKSENPVLQVDMKGINVLKIAINGKEKTVLTDKKIALRGFGISGKTKVRLTLINNLRNLMGPHHLETGESYQVGPDCFFKEKCVWKTGEYPLWNDAYCFVEMSV